MSRVLIYNDRKLDLDMVFAERTQQIDYNKLLVYIYTLIDR